jgi:hypothetical protein
VDGEQDCNLSDNAKKKLTIVDDGSKDDSEEGSEEDGGDNEGLKEAIELFKDVKPNNKYKITIGNYIANNKRNKGDNKVSGNILVCVTEVSSNNIFFEVLKTEGSGAKEYDDLLDKDLTFIKNSKNIKIKKGSKADFKMFDIKIEARDGKTSDDDGGSLTQKDDVIANIMDFKLIGPCDEDEDDEEVGLTKAEIKKAVEDDDILKDMIQKRPVKFMEFISSSIFRKKGIIPSQEIFSKWGAANSEGGAFLNLSEGDEIEFKFGENFKLEKVGAEDKLEKFVKAVKNKDGAFKGKVGRYKPGGKYISILCEELDGIYYRLRLYEDKSSGSDDVVEVKIAFYDKNYNGGEEIAKDKIKIIKNKSKKK